MCLPLGKTSTRKEARSLKPMIAKKNISVWKELTYDLRTKEYCSPFYGMVYEPDKTYRIKRLGKNIRFVSYSFGWIIQIERGLHFYKNPPFCWDNKVVVKMIIPKGSRYYVSTDGMEIVSDCVKTPRKFPLPKRYNKV